MITTFTKRARGLLLAVSVAGCATVARGRLPEGQPVVDGDVFELATQGMTILVKRVAHEPVTSCQLYLRGGVRNWTAETAGIEKLALETAVNGGIVGLDKPAFHGRLAALGTQLVVESGEDYAVLAFKTLNRSFDDSFELMAEALLHPLLPDPELALQRQLMLSELRQEDENPDALLSKLLHEQLYRGLPYSWRAVGTPAGLERLRRGDLERHLETLRKTSRILLVVVGDVDPAQVVELARKEFGSLPRGEFGPAPLQRPPSQATHVELIARDLPTHYLAEAFPAPTWGDPDMAVGVVAMNTLREKLFEEIRTRRELSYAPSAGLSTRGLGEGYLYVTAVDVAKAASVMQQVVRDFQAGKIDPRRLEGDKRIFLTNFLMQAETTGGQGELLAGAELFGGDWRLARDLLAQVKQVHAEQVAAFLRRYLHDLQIIVVGKTEGLSPQLFEDRPPSVDGLERSAPGR